MKMKEVKLLVGPRQTISNRRIFVACRLLIVLAAASSPKALHSEQPARPANTAAVDAQTLRHKVLCGYQGWFRCPGDSTGRGWKHWSRDRAKITPRTVTFEMWPDMSECTDDEKHAAPGFTYPGGEQAHLFSSAHPQTVERHFRWMRRYGIDGAFLQRFLVELDDPSLDRVLEHVRAAANRNGRVFALTYDLTGANEEEIYDQLVADWKRLVDEEKITADPRYLHHNGKPVLMVWGFYSDRFSPQLAHRIIDFFQSEGRYGVTLVGGCQWRWREEEQPAWAKVFRRFDVISPWNVGNVTLVDGRKQAATAHWSQDLRECRRAGMEYLPVIYPGFGWTNLKGRQAAKEAIPRLGGEFYWRQFTAADELGVEMAYVAMFDEVDEATAIFKVTNSPPTQGDFTTYNGLPPDWYLRLTGEGAKVIRGEQEAQSALPIQP